MSHKLQWEFRKLGNKLKRSIQKILTLCASDFYPPPPPPNPSFVASANQPWDLLKIEILHFLFFEWAYSSWYKYECLVVPWDHIPFRASMTRCYAFSFKIPNHLIYKVSGATNKIQNGERTQLKVSDEVGWSRLFPYKAVHELFISQFITAWSIFTPVKKGPIPWKNETLKVNNKVTKQLTWR